MFKKILFLFLAAAFALSACSTLEVTIDQTATPYPTQTQRATLKSPTQTATARPATKQPTADPSLPTFESPYFYWSPIKHSGCEPAYETIFPAKVRRVHARWKYANMREGLLIHREWYHDGELWSQMDELWDFAKYGADGTVDDTYIYDFDAGLAPGQYELRVFINDQPQFGPELAKHMFTVDKDWSLEVASPNGLTTAIVAEPDKLKLRAADGTTWELIQAHEISNLAWFPDSKHMVYFDTEWPQTDSCDTYHARKTLWIIDAATGEQHSVQGNGEPLPSPDGKYLATLDGTYAGHDCKIDSHLKLIALDANFQPTGSLGLEDFSGIPAGVDGSSILPAALMGVAHWKDAIHFETTLLWTCPAKGSDPSGIYSFDMEKKQATRIGDLP